MLEKVTPLGGFDGWGPDYQNIHHGSLEKIAAECYTPQELVEVMGKLTPRPEGRYILLNALGAFEYWGENKNGDAFPEWSLKGAEPPKEVLTIIEHKVKPKIPTFQIPLGRYGYKTFVDFAHVYVGHQNTDPAKAIGDVIAAAYNERMHRVELIVFVYTARNPELVQKLDAGEPVPFSMGSKLQYDQCSVCLNVARTRGEYCDHLRFQLRQILPNGQKVFSYNFFPRFFDISYVRVPADRSAWGLRKVASAAQAELPTRRQDVIKLADIIKNETTVGENLTESPINPKLISFIKNKAKEGFSSCESDPNLIREAAKFKLRKVLASLSALGIVLQPKEVSKLAEGNSAEFPRFDLKDVDVSLMRRFSSYVKDRSYYNPHFEKRASTPTKGRVDTPYDEANQQYHKYLKTIDVTKLAEWFDSSPVAKMSILGDDMFAKLAGLEPDHRDVPAWLPFFTTLLSIDEIVR